MAYMSKEHVKQIRENLKKEFPSTKGWKFSVTNEHFSGVAVHIMKSPIDFGLGNRWSINHYHIDRDVQKNTAIIKKMFKIINDGNYNNSDAMTDYYDVGFYVTMEIGKWDKPCEFVNE